MQYTIHLRGASSAAQTYSKAGGSIRSDAEVYKKAGLVRFFSGQVPPCAFYCTCQMSLLYSSIVRSEEK